MNIPKSEEDQRSSGLKVTEEPNLYCVENKSTIIKSSEFNSIFKNTYNIKLMIWV